MRRLKNEGMDILKCVVVGDGAVGKTCMLMSYVNNSFPTGYVPTVFDNYAVNLKIGDDAYVLQLFDTAGQEEYDRLRILMYPMTEVFLVCFSVMETSSFQNLKDTWVPELKYNCPNTPFIVVGTQIDRRVEYVPGKIGQILEQPVTYEEGAIASKMLGAEMYVECSALTQQGLKNVFDESVSTVMKSRKEKKSKSLLKRWFSCLTSTTS